jgi:hypothetical protein
MTQQQPEPTCGKPGAANGPAAEAGSARSARRPRVRPFAGLAICAILGAIVGAVGGAVFRCHHRSGDRDRPRVRHIPRLRSRVHHRREPRCSPRRSIRHRSRADLAQIADTPASGCRRDHGCVLCEPRAPPASPATAGQAVPEPLAWPIASTRCRRFRPIRGRPCLAASTCRSHRQRPASRFVKPHRAAGCLGVVRHRSGPPTTWRFRQ